MDHQPNRKAAVYTHTLVRVRRRFPALELLATVQEVKNRSYTGRVEVPMVGAAKAQAVALHAVKNSIDLQAPTDTATTSQICPSWS